MFDYEFGQAGCNLDEIKDNLKEYLINSYHATDQDPKNQSEKTFKYLEDLVDKVIKRKDYRMQFGGGGSPLWHAAIFKYLSRWVQAELKMCEMLSKELETQLEND